MKYSAAEVMQYVAEEDVKFIRLAFCDITGRQKNISIMPGELGRAFEYGIAIDSSAIDGFGDETHSDLFLHPDPSTLSILPWRPEHGRVIRMYCSITDSGGKPFACDTRELLKKAISDAKKAGVSFDFGAEMEFYLFKLDERGNRTKIPYDDAGYMDIAPEDKGENVRREICLTLEQMGIMPESSHHEEGPGQNEIDFRYSDALSAADNAMTFQTVVKTIAHRNGLWADFSPKPIKSYPGNGLHVNISARASNDEDILPYLIAGIIDHIREMTVFLNPTEESYERFGSHKAPQYISWSSENRSQLIRVPASSDDHKRAELRSPDPTANPYLAFAVLIYAGLEGVKKHKAPPASVDSNLFKADEKTASGLRKLPSSLEEAVYAMRNSEFIKEYIPSAIIEYFSGK